ncbi:MAG: rhomboid family intramembrane serine protease [Planctomycetaceae bacterium]|jgi:membrane associated rhomboid family serine protease|nr:rhomboid family intramembrane serine protease [Planctomycetaceae bacterium]
MGFYDRDYYREGKFGGYGTGGRDGGIGSWQIVTLVIILNVFLWLVDALLFPKHWLTEVMSLRSDCITDPLQWYRFLTCGFAHSPFSLWHILGNMLVLFCLGYAVEDALRRWEFLRFYLVAVVFSSLVFMISKLIDGEGFFMLGASGAVTAVVVLFVLYYPYQVLLVWGIFPVPAWLIGAILVGTDIFGAVGRMGNTAFTAHLGGAAFALIYAYSRMNLGFITYPYDYVMNLLLKRKQQKYRKKQQFKVYSYEIDDDNDNDTADEITKRVDEILKKCSEHGEGSLTHEEREFMNRASAKYRDKYR